MSEKVIDAAGAVGLIRSADTVAIQGAGGGVAEPTALLRALGARYAAEGAPRDLTLYHATGLGDRSEIGTDYLAQRGLVKRDIAGHLAMAPKMARMASVRPDPTRPATPRISPLRSWNETGSTLPR